MTEKTKKSEGKLHDNNSVRNNMNSHHSNHKPSNSAEENHQSVSNFELQAPGKHVIKIQSRTKDSLVAGGVKFPKSRYLFPQNSHMKPLVSSETKQKHISDSSQHSSSDRPTTDTDLTNVNKITVGSNSNKSKQQPRRRNSKYSNKHGLKLSQHRADNNDSRFPEQNSEKIKNASTNFIEKDKTKIKSGLSRESKRPKYKYGLRRGLPAITVDNFSMKQPDEPAQLINKPRPWFTYSSQKDKAENQHRKVIQFFSTTQIPIKNRNIAEFGPGDAITDEFRNNLLYEYIRDQKKEI